MTTLSPEERAKSLGEELFDAVIEASREPNDPWPALPAEIQSRFERAALTFAASLTATIQALTARAEKVEQQVAAYREALQTMRTILCSLQPALNVMAREVMDDIIREQIDAALSPVTEEAK